MSTTPRLAFPEISSSQSQKEVTHNAALKILDAFCFCAIEDRDLTAPPGSPVEGKLYIPKATATGLWTGLEDKLVQYYNAAWVPYTPTEGYSVYVKDEDLIVVYSGSAWVFPSLTLAALVVTGAFGCNGKTAQTAYSSGSALSSYVTGAFGLNSDANMKALYDLVVAMRAALIANGIMS